MDQEKLQKALGRAEERIVLGEKKIAHQKEIIAELERTVGIDARAAASQFLRSL